MNQYSVDDYGISLSELKNRSHTVSFSWGNTVNKEDNDNMNKENSSCINERVFIVKIENSKKIREIYTWLNEHLIYPCTKVVCNGNFIYIKYYLAYNTTEQINKTNNYLEFFLKYFFKERITIIEMKADSIIAIINEDIRRNAEMDDFWKEIFKERDRLSERCKYLENACNNLSYRAFLRHIRMPNITDYTYDPNTATTTITWSDNTTTTVTAEDKATADQYTGFMTAYAKKAAGNTSRIQSIYEKALKLPEKKALAEQKAKEKEEEQKKIRENQKVRKHRQRVRREARRRKEQYERALLNEEAKRLAEKEYGVPYDNNDWLNTGEDKGHETT